MQTTPLWHDYQQCPTGCFPRVAVAFNKNKKSFIIAAHDHGNYNGELWGLSNGKWQERSILSAKSINIPVRNSSITVNPRTQSIFIIYDGKITEYKTDNTTVVHDLSSSINVSGYNSHRHCIVIDDSIFLFQHKSSVFEWNINTATAVRSITMDCENKIGNYGLMCRGKKVYFFGGKDSLTRKYSKTISSFDMSTNVHKTFNASLPVELASVGCATAMGNQCIIIVGGLLKGGVFSDKIYVFDIKSGIVMTSSVKCPKPSKYFAKTEVDREKDEYLSCGYVKEEMTRSDIEVPALYLLLMIRSFYINERTVLVDLHTRKVCMIETLKIISGCTSNDK